MLTTSRFTYLCLWYGLLYVTCDGIESYSRGSMDQISPDYVSHRSTLSDFRNAMFHVQSKYWTSKLTCIAHHPELNPVLCDIHKRVGMWIKQQLSRVNEE